MLNVFFVVVVELDLCVKVKPVFETLLVKPPSVEHTEPTKDSAAATPSPMETTDAEQKQTADERLASAKEKEKESNLLLIKAFEALGLLWFRGETSSGPLSTERENAIYSAQSTQAPFVFQSLMNGIVGYNWTVRQAVLLSMKR